MQIQTELLEDLPVLSKLMSETNLVEDLDCCFKQNGKWKELSFGKTVFGLLLYIINEGDHRMYRVADWAAQRAEVLKWLLEEPGFSAQKHLSDDRLGLVLERFAGAAYTAFQAKHNGQLLRIYGLEGEGQVFRADATTAQGYARPGDLLQKGYSKSNKRPDLVQVKAMMLSIDPYALPLSVMCVGGNRADDQLYPGLLQQAWSEGLTPSGSLIVADCKMGNEANFLYIAASGNFYLCPLSDIQFGARQVDEALDWAAQHGVRAGPLWAKAIPPAGTQQRLLCSVLELPQQTRFAPATDRQAPPPTWQHRRLLVCSEELRQTQLRSLEQRCEKTILDIQERLLPRKGRKLLCDEGQTWQFIRQVLKRNRTEGLFEVLLSPPSGKGRPCSVSCQVLPAAFEQHKRRAGWRAFASNAPAGRFSAADLVLCYRQEWRIEQQFHALLNKCTALQPIYLKKENRIEALIRLLCLALQYVNLLQFKIRTALPEQAQPYLTHLVPGNPGRKVYNPTTSMLLQAFASVFLLNVELAPGTSVFQTTSLTPIQLKIISLCHWDENIFLHPSCQRTRGD